MDGRRRKNAVLERNVWMMPQSPSSAEAPYQRQPAVVPPPSRSGASSCLWKTKTRCTSCGIER